MDTLLAALQHSDPSQVEDVTQVLSVIQEPLGKKGKDIMRLAMAQPTAQSTIISASTALADSKRLFEHTAKLFATLCKAATQQLRLDHLDTSLDVSLDVTWFDKSLSRNAAIAHASDQSASEAREILQKALVEAMPSFREQIETHEEGELPHDAKCFLYAWLHENSCTQQPASSALRVVIDGDGNEFGISADRYPDFLREYATCTELQTRFRDAMEPGTPLICLVERRGERFPLFLDVQMKSAELKVLMHTLHKVVIELGMSSTTTKFIVSMSEQPDVSGDFKIRIHSPELLVGMDEVTTLISKIKETAEATCTDEISMLGSATARQCATCAGTTKATQRSKKGTCPACVYGPLAIRNGCNSREDPPDRMQIQGVYVDGVLDVTETNILQEDFCAAVTQTSIGRLAEGGAVLRASVVDGPVHKPVDEKGKAKLVGRRAHTILELSDPKVLFMTEVVRGFHPKWSMVEPREVICLEPVRKEEYC
eukprot:2501578-Prymnesium_polylepis.1